MRVNRLIAAAALLLAVSPAATPAQDTPGSVKFPAALDTQDSLIRAANSARTTLSGALNGSATTITVASTASFPSSGAAIVDNEIFFYSAKTSTTFTGVTRGTDSTSAAAHSSGAAVRGVITAAHVNTHASAIVAVETKVGSGASTPAANTVFVGTGPGTSEWGTLTSSHLPSSITISGTLTAGDIVGNCSACTGIGIGTSTGSSATQSLSLIFDSDNSGGGTNDAGGVLDVIQGSTTVVRVHNDGTLDALSGLKLSGGAFDSASAYYRLHFADETQQTWTQGNSAFPTLGVAGYPAYTPFLLTGSPASGNMFGMVVEVETGPTLKGALPGGHLGGYVVGMHATARSTVGATTTMDVYGGNFVAEANPGHSLGLVLGTEVSVNNNVADAAADFTTVATAPTVSVVGVTIGSGGVYSPHNGLEFFASYPGDRWRRAIVVPHESITHRAFEVGTISAPIPASLPGLIAVKGINTGNGYSFHRGASGDTGNAFAAYTETTVLAASLNVDGWWEAQWYKAVAGDGFQAWKDSTPTKAIAVSTVVPGGTPGDDFIVSTYSSTGVSAGVWRNRWQINNQTNVITVGGAYTDQWGSGSPEGVVTATPGSGYRDTTGGRLYIKESGSGNTGWVLK